MLDVSEEVKELYLNDNTPVNLKLLIDDVEYTDRNVVAGSMSIVESICSLETFELSSVEKNQIEFSLFNETQSISDLTGKTVTAVHVMTVQDGTVEIPLGKYKIVTSEFDTDYVIHCIGYDEMLKFDEVIDDWWNTTVTFPITIKDLVIQLFQHLNVTYDLPETFNNSSFTITSRTAFLENTKASELLGQIQEIVGGFFKADRYGTVKLLEPQKLEGLYPRFGLYPRQGLYPTNANVGYGVNAEKVDYTYQNVFGDLTTADYKVKAIDKVQIRGTEEDVGISYGTGTNVYVVQGNILLLGITPEEGETIAHNIYNAIYTLEYIPFRGEFTALPYIEVGDFAHVTSRKGIVAKAPILYRVLSNQKLSVDTFIAKGTEYRQAVKEFKKGINVLRQRTHEIVNTVDELSSTITDLETELDENYLTKDETRSEISQSADSIISTVSQTYATIDRVSGVETTVNSHTSQISQNTSAISSVVSDVSTITTTVSGLSDDVDNLEDEVSTVTTTVSEHTSSINQNTNSIDLMVKEKNLYVNYLSNSNFTNIEYRLKYWYRDIGTEDLATVEYITDSDFDNASGYALRINKTGTTSSYARAQSITFDNFDLNGKTVYVLYSLKLNSSSKQSEQLVNRVRYKLEGSSNWTNLDFSWITVASEDIGKVINYRKAVSFSTETKISVLDVAVPYAWGESTADYEVNNFCLMILPSALPAPELGTWVDYAKTDVVTQINMSPEGILIRGDKIDIYGVTTFHNSDGTGGTTIDGATITAGDMYWYKGTANEARLFATGIIFDNVSYDALEISGNSIELRGDTGVIWLENTVNTLYLSPISFGLMMYSGASIIGKSNNLTMAVGNTLFRCDGTYCYVSTCDYGGTTPIEHKVVWRTINGIWALCLG